jgi:plastocyanin
MKQMDRSAVLAVLVAGALVSSCGGGGGGNSAPTAPNPPTANPGTPEPAARIGQKVQWRNNDRVLHRIVQDRAGDDGNNSGDPYGGGGGQGGSGGTGFDGGDTAPEGMSSAMTLSAAGTLRYHCAIHPGMVGSIVVQ